MKYCERCGAELEDSLRFCGQCGQPVTEEPQEQPKDYWAQRLQAGNREEIPEEVRSCEEELPPAPGDEDAPVVPELDWEKSRPDTRVRRLWGVVSVLCGFIAILVIVLVIFMGLRKDPPVRELYYGRACLVGEDRYTGEGDWVALTADGKAELFLLNSGAEGSWSQQGKNITVNCGDRIFTGSVENGVMTLEQGELRFLLAKEGVPLLPQQSQQAMPTDSFTGWEGDYYGWWRVSRAWGQWEDTAGESWDVCGRIWMEPEGMGKLELWDTQCGMGELFCAADISITPGLTDAGCLESGTGRFCDYPLLPGDWVIDPARKPYSQAPGLLCLRGSFGEGDSGFSYEIFLKPWGQTWEDVEGFASPLLPEGNRLPPLYKDWYLPLIERQEPMPESFYGVSEP